MILDDAVNQLLEKASGAMTTDADGVRHGAVHIAYVLHHVQQFRETADHLAQFTLLPLGLAIFILHEHYRSAGDGSPFRVGYVLLRTGVVVALVLGYAKICAVITHVAGGGGGWMTSENYLGLYDSGADSLGNAWNAWGGISNLPKFIGMVIVWVILMMSVLFAFIAGALLSHIQGVTLALLLGLGKTCIIVSLVPGVGLGKSWARGLAMVAGWSTVAHVLLGLMSVQNVQIGKHVVSGEFVPLLKASADFVIIALMTLSVPIITAKLFSGGAAALSEVAPAFGAGMAAAKLTGWLARGGRSVGRRTGDAPPPAPGGPSHRGTSNEGDPRRAHKVPFRGTAVPGPARPSLPPRPRPASVDGPATQPGSPPAFDEEAPTAAVPPPRDANPSPLRAADPPTPRSHTPFEDEPTLPNRPASSDAAKTM